MLRLLLLVPTTTYRTEEFVQAAARLDVDVVVASERPNVFGERLPDNLLTLDFNDPDLIRCPRNRGRYKAGHPASFAVAFHSKDS